jgi:hypothetical protein
MKSHEVMWALVTVLNCNRRHSSHSSAALRLALTPCPFSTVSKVTGWLFAGRLELDLRYARELTRVLHE